MNEFAYNSTLRATGTRIQRLINTEKSCRESSFLQGFQFFLLLPQLSFSHIGDSYAKCTWLREERPMSNRDEINIS